MPWFTTKGQALQLLVSIAALCLTARPAFLSMATSDYFSAGVIPFYLLVILVMVSSWHVIRAFAERRKSEGQASADGAWPQITGLLYGLGVSVGLYFLFVIVGNPGLWPSFSKDPPPSYWSGPIGPSVAVRFVHAFSRLPKPCRVKITHTQENENLATTLTGLLKSGGMPIDDASRSRLICEVEDSQMPLPNIDEPDPVRLTTQPGIVIHFNAEYGPGEQIVDFFYDNGFKVSTSHRLPVKSSPDLIWLDIGPGDPWRDRR